MDLMKFTMLILAASAAAALSAQTRLAPVAVRGGETIAFVGDSITHNGYHQMFLKSPVYLKSAAIKTIRLI